MRLNLTEAQKSIDRYFRKKKIRASYKKAVQKYGPVLQKLSNKDS